MYYDCRGRSHDQEHMKRWHGPGNRVSEWNVWNEKKPLQRYSYSMSNVASNVQQARENNTGKSTDERRTAPVSKNQSAFFRQWTPRGPQNPPPEGPKTLPEGFRETRVFFWPPGRPGSRLSNAPGGPQKNFGAGQERLGEIPGSFFSLPRAPRGSPRGSRRASGGSFGGSFSVTLREHPIF